MPKHSKNSHKSVTIERADNGFLVSSYDEMMGKRKMSVHKTAKEAMGSAMIMMGGKMISEKEMRKMIKKKMEM